MRKYALPLFCCTLGMIAGSILSYIVIFVPWMEERTYHPPPHIAVERDDWRKGGESMTFVKGGEAHGISFGLFEGNDADLGKRNWFLLVRNIGMKYVRISGGLIELTNSQGVSIKVGGSRQSEGKLTLGQCSIYHLQVPYFIDTTNLWTLSLSGDVVIPGIKFVAKK